MLKRNARGPQIGKTELTLSTFVSAGLAAPRPWSFLSPVLPRQPPTADEQLVGQRQPSCHPLKATKTRCAAALQRTPLAKKS